MRIVTRIALIVLIPIVLGIAILIAQLYTAQRMADELASNARVMKVQEDIFTLNLLMSEISRYPEEQRPRKQWVRAYHHLSLLLSDIHIYKQAPREYIDILLEYLEQLSNQFDRIELATGSDISPSIRQELLESTTGTMQLMVSNMLNISQQMVEESSQQMLIVKRWSDLATLGVIILMVLLLGLMAVIMGRRIIKPMLSIRDSIALIGAGDLDHRLIVSSRRDELSALANAFNKMLDRLQDTMASRDELDREMHARKLSEAALRQSEERYRYLLTNLPQKVFYKDIEGQYLAVNPSYSREFDMAPDDFVGKNDYDFFPKADADKYRMDDRDVIKSGEIREFDEHYQRGGEVRTVHTVKAPVIDDEGNPLGVLGIFWDVTEEKRAQEEVKVAQEYLRNVINSMPAVLIGLDMNGCINHWNSMAIVKTGITEKDVLGKRLDEIEILPEEITQQLISAVFSREQTQLLNQNYRDAQQSRSVDITIYPVTIDGTGGTVIIISDVTERTRVESMMVQTEKMLSVGGLAAGMAHELNSPLGGILQGMQNIERRVSPDLRKNREEADLAGIDLEKMNLYLDKRNILGLMKGITDAGHRASGIVNNMMNFSRTLSEKVSPVKIAGLIDSVLELASIDYDLKKKYAFRDIKIVKDYADNLPYVDCLEKDIKQVILNILRNSAQMLSKQKDRQEPPSITLRTRLEGDNARIEIEDNGPGMDEQIRSRIFEPFFTTHEVGEGSGLGLSVAYFLIHDQHHGEIIAESQSGTGTRIIIKIPLRQRGDTHETA